MSRTLPFEAANENLRELVEGMIPGEEIVLTSHAAPLAIITRRRRGTKHWMAPDFDAPLEDFKEYMQEPAARHACIPLVLVE